MNITVKTSTVVGASPETVWDFTQDWTRRHEWDASVSAAEILATDPLTVRVTQGGMKSVYTYKASERPSRTSLALTEVSMPFLIAGGGGSWTYEPTPDGGTTWTQTNTLKLSNRLLYWLFGGFIRWQLERATQKAMQAAKRAIESK